MKLLFWPHDAGFGHRVRCNAIAKRLAPRAKIVMFDYAQDAQWTEFPRVRGGLMSRLSLMTSDVVVEDGRLIPPRTRSWARRIVSLVHPDIGDEWLPALEENEKVIVPYPDGMLEDSWALKSVDGVIRTGPVLNLPPNGWEWKPEDSYVYDLRSRGGFTHGFMTDDEHFARLARASVVITQGTTSMWEMARLGIPQVAIPHTEEQKGVAWKMVDLGFADMVKEGDAPELENVLKDEAERVADIWAKWSYANHLFPDGTKDIAREIMLTAADAGAM